MNKVKICADAKIAYSLMDALFNMYMAFVKGVGGDYTSPIVKEKAIGYARVKFVELANEFENNLMTWNWIEYEQDEDEEDDN